MHSSLLKALIPAAPQRPASLVRGLGLNIVALRRLPMGPCASFHATGIFSALRSARPRQAAGGPQCVLKSVRPAPLCLFSTNSSSTNSSSSGTSYALFNAFCTGLLSVASLAGLYFAFEATRRQLEIQAILAAHAPLSAADERKLYVQRNELEETFSSFLNDIKPYGYMVVVGPRGAGKSTLVPHMLKELGSGVFIVPIDVASETAPGLRDLIRKTALQQYAPSLSWFATFTPLKDGDLAERLKAVAKAGREEGRGEGWLPTVVLEITSSADGALIKNACTVLKALAADQPLCHGILVLSSSFAVAGLTDDPGRQHFLHVGAFSRDEASASLDAQFKADLPDEIATVAAVTMVKERILPLTTLPMYLRRFARELAKNSANEAEFVARAEVWASKFEEEARTNVNGACSNALNIFIRDETGTERCFTMRDLMRKLLDTGGPIQMGSTTYDVTLGMLASKMRTSEEAKAVFTVDHVSKTVDFADAAHRQAAAKLLAQPPPTSSRSGWLLGRWM